MLQGILTTLFIIALLGTPIILLRMAAAGNFGERFQRIFKPVLFSTRLIIVLAVLGVILWFSGRYIYRHYLIPLPEGIYYERGCQKHLESSRNSYDNDYIQFAFDGEDSLIKVSRKNRVGVFNGIYITCECNKEKDTIIERERHIVNGVFMKDIYYNGYDHPWAEWENIGSTQATWNLSPLSYSSALKKHVRDQDLSLLRLEQVAFEFEKTSYYGDGSLSEVSVEKYDYIDGHRRRIFHRKEDYSSYSKGKLVAVYEHANVLGVDNSYSYEKIYEWFRGEVKLDNRGRINSNGNESNFSRSESPENSIEELNSSEYPKPNNGSSPPTQTLNNEVKMYLSPFSKFFNDEESVFVCNNMDGYIYFKGPKPQYKLWIKDDVLDKVSDEIKSISNLKKYSFEELGISNGMQYTLMLADLDDQIVFEFTIGYEPCD